MYARLDLVDFERFEGTLMAKRTEMDSKPVKLPKQERPSSLALYADENEEINRFKQNVPKVIDLWSERLKVHSQREIARVLDVEPETISRWKSNGIKRTRAGSIVDFCERVGIIADSMWEEELRLMDASPQSHRPTESVMTLDQKFQALKSTGSWPIIAALLDKLYDAERK